MGCVGGFNKNCDKCIRVLRQYGEIVKKNNYTCEDKEKIDLKKKSNICKKNLNDALEKMNKNVKNEYETKQLKEFNEIYQKLLDIESERNKNKLENNNIIKVIEFSNDDYDDLNKIV